MSTLVSQPARTQPPNEQRLSIRKRIPKPIPIELLPGKEVWLHDLGEGGLSVSGSSNLELGTSTYIRFQFPETNSLIDAAGVIAWSDLSGRAGVRFTRVEGDSTAALRRWLSTESSTAAAQETDTAQMDSALAGNIACLNEVSELQASISSQQLDSAAALDVIVRRMLDLTRASGAAIALRDGQDVVCRATVGNAPDVGVRLSSTSLSAECFRTGTIVLLNDSENDLRVNPELCRELNFRSLLVIPITSGNELVGIAEVLSPNPRNFDGGDVLVLSFLAELIAGVAVATVETDALDIVKSMDLSELNEESALEAPKPALPDLVPAIDQYRTELIETPALAAAIAEPVPVITDVRDSRVASAIEARLPALSDKISLAAKPTARRRISWLVPVASAAIVLLVFAAVLLNFYRRQIVALTESGVQRIAAKPSPSSAAKVIPAAVVAAAGSGSAPATRAASKSETSRPLNPVVKARENVVHPNAVQPEELQVIQGSSAQVKAATEAPAPEALAISGLAAHDTSALLPDVIASNAKAPDFKPVQSQGVTGGKLIRKVLPRYPEMARRAGVTGDVVLTATISVDGSLRDIKVISGSPLLREEAIVAAKQWRYSPYLLGGKPVQTETRITMNFNR